MMIVSGGSRKVGTTGGVPGGGAESSSNTGEPFVKKKTRPSVHSSSSVKSQKKLSLLSKYSVAKSSYKSSATITVKFTVTVKSARFSSVL